jgi:hypothetical protein
LTYPLPSRWRVYAYVGSNDGTNYATAFYVNGLYCSGINTGQGLQGHYCLSGYDATGTQETCDCEVAEVLIYNRPLNTNERLTVADYLNKKWVARPFHPQDLPV